MAKVKTKKRNPIRSKEKILLSAEKLFAKYGPAATVDLIAKKSNLNKRMVYHYFGSKEKLWQAVIQRQYQKVSTIEAKIKNSENITQIISSLIEKYYKFLVNDKYFVKLLMHENLKNGQAIKNLQISKTKIPIIEKLKDAIKKSHIKDMDAQNLLIDCLALCFFYFSNQTTLSALFEKDLSNKKQISNRINHIKKLFTKVFQ